MIDTANRISNLIASKLRIDPRRINEATNFVDDLAVTSLDLVETIMSLEDEVLLGSARFSPRWSPCVRSDQRSRRIATSEPQRAVPRYA